ncbi:Coenzyme F420 hydrogenase/dehydrogenase, beta subunit C-terminal domain [Luteolibacter sp. AS25]|uniref:Coenzyme F420 hydrogenase/dehydrogenase, beta subunit C-terminal domain n=1 Tax=Luteolibacter sp. AS25 TaxID=3135776 RepID=UPI00398A6907
MKTIKDIVEGNYCIGCGGCAYVASLDMKMNRFGEYTPDTSSLPKDELLDKAGFVCPFLNEEFNEDRLGEEFLKKENPNHSNKIGYYREVLGGHVVEEGFRSGGTSGGFGTWIGSELLKRGMIDGVIHVKDRVREEGEGPFSNYSMSLSQEDILSASRTKYHVIEYSEVLKKLEKYPEKRFLFIGLPCVVKSIRRLQIIDPRIRDSIAFTVALVCGHLKSMNWSLSLGWGCGIEPKDFRGIRYRTKGENIPARAYAFTAFADGAEVLKDSAEIVGGKFNQGALMLNACNFCDDVVGETADLTIGDAWLPRFEVDSGGNNMLVVRNEAISRILNEATAEGRVSLSPLSEKEAVDAQAGGFRQRREGLSQRVTAFEKAGVWHPVKRVSANEFKVPIIRSMVYRMRSHITELSRVAFADALERDDYQFYKRKLQIRLKILRAMEIFSSLPRILRKQTSYVLLRIGKMKKS